MFYDDISYIRYTALVSSTDGLIDILRNGESILDYLPEALNIQVEEELANGVPQIINIQVQGKLDYEHID